MRCEAWKPVEPESEKVNKVRVVWSGVGAEACAMAVVNELGNRVEHGCVAVLTPTGLRRVGDLDPALGFPLNSDGRIKLDE